MKSKAAFLRMIENMTSQIFNSTVNNMTKLIKRYLIEFHSILMMIFMQIVSRKRYTLMAFYVKI
jgi:hypothetical protein